MTYESTCLADSPVIFWLLNETSGTTAVDASGNGNAGTYTGGFTLGVTGPPGAGMGGNLAVTLNGTTGYTGSNGTFTNYTSVSAEGWFKTTSASGGGILLWDGSNLNVYMSNNGTVTLGTYNGSVIASCTTSGAFNDGNWHYIVAVFVASSSQVLYIDNVNVASVAPSSMAGGGGNPQAAAGNGQNITSSWPGTQSSNFLAGTFADFAIYPAALTTTQIGNHWAAATASGVTPAATIWQPVLAPAAAPRTGPGVPGGEPFVPWPQYTAGAGQSDLITAAQTVTATITATLVNAPAPWELPPQYPPAWFPSAPGAPGGDPFVPWPLGQTGVDTLPLNAAATVTATDSAALTEAKPLNAAATVTATGAAAETTAKPLNAATTVTATAVAALSLVKAGVTPAPAYPPAWFPSAPSAPGTDPFTPWPPQQGAGAAAVPGPDLLNAASIITATGAAVLTEAKPVNAATTVTATGAAAETTAKPLNAAVTVTATAAASLTLVKAGVTPVPAYPPAWFPAAPSVPDGQPFAPWPVWTGTIPSATPVDTLAAAATITATDAATLTEAKPVNAATTVTATGAAAETTAKPATAAATVTATAAASLTVVKAGVTPAPVFTPGWFPGAPFVPGAEVFAPWPVWTGMLTAPFTIGALTASDVRVAVLTATDAAGASGGVLTAADQRTGGPG